MSDGRKEPWTANDDWRAADSGAVVAVTALRDLRVLRLQDPEIGFLFGPIRDAVVAGDVDTAGVVRWNPAAEALFAYMAMVAHGLDAPLAAICGLVDRLDVGQLTPADEARALTTIRAEANLLRPLVADVHAAAAVDALLANPVAFAAAAAPGPPRHSGGGSPQAGLSEPGADRLNAAQLVRQRRSCYGQRATGTAFGSK